ncbi:MAG: DNA topoisomerase, partial [Candidatus Baldrarchaeia archaeon]
MKTHQILMISEKYKQALAIAKALGKVGKRTINNVPVFIVKTNRSNIIIVPLRGHITEYSTKTKYEKWSQNDPKLILLDKNSLKKIYKEKKYVELLRTLAKQCDDLIFATDADEEGENIAFEAWEIIREVNPKLKPKRLWLHTLIPSDICEAFRNLIEPKWTWAYAVEARRQIDALIGFAATRELTLALKPFLKHIGTNVISVGRVQTPTLYLIYSREKEIKNFVPEPYWNLLAEINVHGTIIKVRHVDSPFKDKKLVALIYDRIKEEKYAILEDVRREEVYIQPPTPFNTTKALKTITKILPITAKTAMKIMEDLYLDALISYPRTDTDRYSPTFPHREFISKFLRSRIYGIYAEEILRKDVLHPRQGKVFKGDHEPITPIDVAEPGDPRFKTRNHWEIYNIIVRRYLALFMPPAKELKINLLFLINKEKFTANITVLLEKGFIKVWQWAEKEYTPLSKLPELATKDRYSIRKIFIEEKKTKPPPRLTESNLIATMQKLNLGTKSTRPQHIETNKKRGYIVRKGKSLYCSEIGWILASNLEKIWP